MFPSFRALISLSSCLSGSVHPRGIASPEARPRGNFDTQASTTVDNLISQRSLTSTPSPNAEEALSLLSLPLPPSRSTVEQAANLFLGFGVGKEGTGTVVIRSGGLGAYTKSRAREGEWVEAYWTTQDEGKVVDVTGEPSRASPRRWADLFGCTLRCREQFFGRASGWIALERQRRAWR